MASIIKRKSNFSVVYRYKEKDGTSKQKWESYSTIKESKTRKAFIEYFQNINGSVLVPLNEHIKQKNEYVQMVSENPDSDITFREFLRTFVNLYGISKWSPSTLSSKQGSIDNYINPLIGDWKLKDITTRKLSKYYNDLLSYPEVPRSNQKATGRSVQPANIKKIHDIIRCALNQAISWEYIDTKMRNPASLAILPKISKNQRDVWDIETFEKAISVADDELLIICMHLAFSCSLRIGEITGLTWNDIIITNDAIENGQAKLIVNKELARVHFQAIQKLKERDIIKVFPTLKPHATTRLVLKTPKTESSNRIVWLPKTVADILAKFKQKQDELKDFLGSGYNDNNLVVALDNGNPVESQVIQSRLKKLCKDNHLKEVVFHSLRHLSTIYKLKMTNGDIKSVQGDTGHAESNMVLDVYSRVIDEDRRHNAQKLDEQFYHSIERAADKHSDEPIDDSNQFFKNLISFMSDEEHREQIKNLINTSDD